MRAVREVRRGNQKRGVQRLQQKGGGLRLQEEVAL
jgi:hypothetical protein